MRSSWIFVFGALLATPAAATDLNLSVEAGGANSVVVAPGDSVSWSVVGELSDAANEGLAFFVFDMSFNGGALTQGDAPVGAPMTSFDTPNGLTNPAGYGGTLSGGDLIQVGGAQNTINNAFAAVPIGSVTTGVAQPGFPEVLVSGTLTAPIAPGTYTLKTLNVMVNTIKSGEIGVPFWAVEEAGVGSCDNLTIEVVAMTANVGNVSLGGLGSQILSLDAGDVNAGRGYFILGSVTGTTPGITVASGTNIPLNADDYFFLLVDNPNTFISNQMSTLDGLGQATATISVPGSTPPILIGMTFDHAFVTLGPIDFASNSVSLTLVP